MKKSGVIEWTLGIGQLIFILFALGSMFFSKSIIIKISCTVLFLAYLIVSDLSLHKKRKKVIKELEEKGKAYISCRENNYTFFLIASSTLVYSLSNLSEIMNSKNEYKGLLEFISQSTIDEKVSVFVYIALIIIAILWAISGLRSVAILGEDNIVLYNGTKIDYAHIIELKYKEALFSNKKIIKLYDKSYNQEIIVKLNEFEKVKRYLEDKIAVVN